MEEDFQANSTIKTFLPLGVGLVGIVMGVVALCFAISSANKASELKESLAAINASIEASANSKKQIKALDEKISKAFEQIESAAAVGKINANAVSKQVQNAVNKLTTEISNNRNLIAKNQEAIGELATRGVRQARTTVTQKPAETQEAQATQSASTGGKIHKVRAGENFSVIAKKYGVNVADIERANPDKDSRRLRIGQEIIIP